MTAALVRMDGVSVVRGGRMVLDSISLELARHEFVTLRGPNGSGKTTLLRCILGLIKPTGGRLAVDCRQGRIGYVPQIQQGATSMPLRVRDVVAIGRCAHPGWGRAARVRNAAAVTEAMRMGGVAALATRPIRMLSGGEHQKMQLARVLAQEPEMLLLDEPTAHLDAASKLEFSGLLERIYATQRVAVLLVTHETHPAQAGRGREIELREGRLHEADGGVAACVANGLPARGDCDV